jgi:hypothetical protein
LKWPPETGPNIKMIAYSPAGIITRRRSEGDRRRTYLQQIPGTLDSLSPPATRAALRVLFVCTAR